MTGGTAQRAFLTVVAGRSRGGWLSAEAQASAAKATAAALGVEASAVTVDEQYVAVKSEVGLGEAGGRGGTSHSSALLFF